MIWAIVSSRSCFCWLDSASPSFAANNIITLWWCTCVESPLVLLKEGVCYDQCVILANSVSLCPASFYTPRPYSPVTSGISWLPTSAFQSPMMKRTSLFFFLVLVLEVVIDYYKTSQLQLIPHQCLGNRLVFLCCWMICLGIEPKAFCHFWDCTQVVHFGLLLAMTAVPFLLRDSFPQ